MPRVLLRERCAGRVKGGRAQRHREPGTKGPGKGGTRGRGRASRQGAGQGQGARAEGRGKEGALQRELPHIVHALAGGQRGREGRAGKRACHGGMKEQAWGSSTKVPHNRASRQQCAGALDKAERCGALPQRTVVQRGPGACLRHACELPTECPARGGGVTGQGT